MGFLPELRFVWNGHAVSFDKVFIGLYILWMLVELRISKRDVSTEGKKTSDSATCQLYGFGQALTFLTALWFPPAWRTPNIVHLLGLSTFVAGVCYRLWAIRTLGQYYSHRVQTLAQHQIVASGPYRLTRHPAYAGMIVANAGISMYFLNWVTVGVFLFILVPLQPLDYTQFCDIVSHANGSTSSNYGGEGEIRKNMIEAGLIDCMVALPAQLFYNTMIPACLWFLARNKANGKFRNRSRDILFIDARKLGAMINRRNKEFSDDDIAQIADTYHSWRNMDGQYEDKPGFCKSATLEEVRKNNHVLMPGRYVGTEAEEDDGIPFDDKMKVLTAKLAEQFARGIELETLIRKNLKGIGYGLSSGLLRRAPSRDKEPNPSGPDPSCSLGQCGNDSHVLGHRPHDPSAAEGKRLGCGRHLPARCRSEKRASRGQRLFGTKYQTDVGIFP